MKKALAFVVTLLLLSLALVQFLPSKNREVDKYELNFENPSRRFIVDEDYRYSANLIDIPYELVTSDRGYFRKWQEYSKEEFLKTYRSVPISPPIGIKWMKELRNEYGVIREYNLEFEGNHLLKGSFVGGCLAIPRKSNRQMPLIIFLYGHGMLKSIASKTTIFEKGQVPYEFFKRSYPILVLDNVYHEELRSLYKDYDYSVMWSKVANQSLELLKDYLPKTDKRIIIGVAAGGLTGLAMAISNPSIDMLITSGSFFPLELTRRDYRIKGHPFCHDFRQYVSYVPLYAMTLDKPLELQMGKKDPLFIGKALEPNRWFTGTKRGVFVEETLGAMFILRQISINISSNFDFVIHEKGHTDFDVDSAIKFIEKCFG